MKEFGILSIGDGTKKDNVTSASYKILAYFKYAFSMILVAILDSPSQIDTIVSNFLEAEFLPRSLSVLSNQVSYPNIAGRFNHDWKSLHTFLKQKRVNTQDVKDIEYAIHNNRILFVVDTTKHLAHVAQQLFADYCILKLIELHK